MNTLLLFDAEGAKLDASDVKEALQTIQGTYHHREGNFIGSVFDCEFDYGDDSTIARLSDDLETISLTGLGDAALKLALELQGRLGRTLRAVDLGYNFDLTLSGIQSLEDLSELIDTK